MAKNDEGEIIDEIRGHIDNIDAAMLFILAERFKHTRRIGELIAQSKRGSLDIDREKDQNAKAEAMAALAHLDPIFAVEYLNFVRAEVRREHELARVQQPGGES